MLNMKIATYSQKQKQEVERSLDGAEEMSLHLSAHSPHFQDLNQKPSSVHRGDNMVAQPEWAGLHVGLQGKLY